MHRPMNQVSKNISRQIERLDKRLIISGALALALLLGYLDHLTGFEFSFSLFYLLPVSVVAWYVDRNSALAVSLLSAAVWFASNKLAGQVYSRPLIDYWNTLVRLGFFVVVSILLSYMRQLMDRERQLSRTDFMTGITNPRAFYELAAAELQRAARYHHPFSVAYMDVDNFKQVNDQMGHNAGDALLKEIAQTLHGCMRQTDTVARLGGDEFILLLPETDEASARATITKVLKFLGEAVERGGWAVTFSIGVVTFYEIPDDVDEMIRKVDALMYTVKASGKNSVCFAREG